jgi:hypothetical protein
VTAYTYRTTHQRVLGTRRVDEGQEEPRVPSPVFAEDEVPTGTTVGLRAGLKGQRSALLFTDMFGRYESYPIDLAPPDDSGAWRLVECALRYPEGGAAFAVAIWEREALAEPERRHCGYLHAPSQGTSSPWQCGRPLGHEGEHGSWVPK